MQKKTKSDEIRKIIKKRKEVLKKKEQRISKRKYEEKILQVKRVTKVVKGGKKMTTQAIVIVGDKKQKVGVGLGKAEDANLAIEKAILQGKKNCITVPLTQQFSIPHIVEASYGACQIMLRPAAEGTGVIAGGAVRTVLELAGVQNILAKQFGSSNMLNNAKATLQALHSLTQTIELATSQLPRKAVFYRHVMKKYHGPNFS